MTFHYAFRAFMPFRVSLQLILLGSQSKILFNLEHFFCLIKRV
uniref:Uncharacterized protein n=1 Tax=Utricularia reniformis TaxID=192314 RepID=A0A1Y0B375_9LAMI|nr:hypothetical protein AEK19_MT1705 [Utricularia reniformis]ART31885.1 hypothetical protein AEK19_MT1705 [Utricularia reniformis]